MQLFKHCPVWLMAVTIMAAPAVNAQSPNNHWQSVNWQRDFVMSAAKAGTSDRWQAIHWQTSMDVAKAVAYKESKPILVVMHNNIGGDVSASEC
jgi:hypothetical protein